VRTPPTGVAGVERDGVIWFTPDALQGVFRVSSGEGLRLTLTKPDSSTFQASHRWPVLPDGNISLFGTIEFQRAN